MTIKQCKDTKDRTKNKVAVLTLNIRFGLADDGKNSWEFRKQALSPLFHKYKNDFIGLQEVNSFQSDFIEKILDGYNHIGKRKPAPRFWQNNVIFYKNIWKCIYYEHFYLSPIPHIPSRFRESRWPRQCTIGIFKKNNFKFICVNTHFDFKTSVQVESAKIIMKHLSSLPSDIPVVVFGDFNASPSSPSHKVFTGDEQKARSKKPFLKNIFKKPFPCTHHKFTGNVEGDYIDWILYRGDIKVNNSKVIYGTINGSYPSDHFPVYAEFDCEK